MALVHSCASQLAHAASGDGSLVGHLNAADKSAVSGAEITARNPDTGFTRTVKADADGTYRFPFLPVGTYTIEASKDGKSLGIARRRDRQSRRRDHCGPGPRRRRRSKS